MEKDRLLVDKALWLRRMAFVLPKAILLLSFAVDAANYWVDVNGTTAGSGVANGGSYDWTAANWGDFAGTATPVAWPGGSNQAYMNGAGASTSYTVRLGATGSSNVTLQNFGININSATSGGSGNGDVVIGNPGDTGILTLNASNSVGAQNGGVLTVNNGINLNAQTFNFRGGDVVINGVVSGTGASKFVFSGGFGLTGGTLTLANTANTYAGRANNDYISANYTLAVTKLANGGSNSSIGTSSANIGINGGTLKYIGSTGAQSTNLGFNMASGGTNIDASGVTSSDTISFSGAPTYTAADSARTLTLTGSNEGNNTIAFVFGNNGIGVNTLNKTGAGKWVLSQANTYTGATTVSGGTLVITNTSQTSGTLSIASGATLELQSATAPFLNTTTPVTFSGAGTLRINGSTSFGAAANSISLSSGALIDVQAGSFNGGASNNKVWASNLADLNVASGATIGTSQASIRVDSLTGLGTIDASSSFSGGSFTFGVDNGTGTTFDGKFTNSAANKFNFTKTGTGTQTISGNSDYTSTMIVSGGVLALTGANSTLLGASTAGLTLSGGRLDLGGLSPSAIGAVSVTAAAGSGDTITNGNLSGSSYSASNASGNAIISANLLGTGTLAKSGAGTLSLSGSNSYTGVTTISAGVLNAATLTNYSVAGGLGARTAVQEVGGNIGLRFMGGTLQYTGSTAQSTDRQIRIGTAGGTIDASGSVPGATVSFTYSGANTDLFDTVGTRTLTLTGTNTGDNTFAIGLTNQASNQTSLTKTGAGKWLLTGNNTHTGLTSTSAGTLVLSGNNSIGRVDINGGTFLVSGGTTSLSSYLTVNTSGSTGTFLQTGGTVQLTSGTNGAYVGNSGSPASIFNMTGGTFTVAGSEGFRMRAGGTSTTSISGGALLSAAGSNGLHFNKSSGSAIFNLGDGSTFVSGTSGILTVSKVWRDAGTSNTFNFNGGTLKASATNASFFVDDANITTLVKSAGGIVDNGGFAITIGEQLAEDGGSPGGGMTFKGSGTTTLTNGNTYTGATSVTAGTLNVQHNNALGTTAGATSLTTGTKLQIQGVGLNIAENLSLGSGSTGATVENVSGTNILSGTITRNGALTFTSSSGHLTVQSGIGNTDNSVNMGGAGDGEISGAISLAYGVNKTGAGTWTLSGNNSFAGATTVSGGALRITHNNALGTTAGSTSVNNLAALQMAGGITVTGESLFLNGTGVANDGALRNISGNNTWAGNISVGAASITRMVSDADLLTITGTVGLSSPASNQFVLQGDGDILLTGVVSGASSVTSSVTGTGVRTLANANTYSGTTTVSGGVLRVQNNSAIGSGTLRLNGGRLTSDANPRTIANSVEVPLDSALGSGTAGFEGAIVLNGDVALTGGDASRVLTVDSPVTLNGTVTGSSLRGLTKAGSSILTLSGSGNWNGNTGVTAGTFQMTGTSSIPSGGNLNASGTGVFRMNTTGVLSASSTSIQDSAEIRLEAGTLRTNSITMGGTGTFNWSGGTLETYSNVVFGSGSDVSQSGGAAVYAGRNLAVTGNLTTGAGVNLDLGDLYLSGPVLYNQITISGALSVGAGTTLSALDSPYLLRPSTGGMNLDWGTLVLVDAAGGIINPGNFNFIAPSADGRPFSPFTGSWVAAGDPAQLDPNTWYLEYTANQVLFHYKVSAAIPEPASAGLFIAGGLLLRLLSRRRAV